MTTLVNLLVYIYFNGKSIHVILMTKIIHGNCHKRRPVRGQIMVTILLSYASFQLMICSPG